VHLAGSVVEGHLGQISVARSIVGSDGARSLCKNITSESKWAALHGEGQKKERTWSAIH
jgi:hypothetical protein